MKLEEKLEVLVPTHIINADSNPYIENLMIEETITSCHSKLNLKNTLFKICPDARFEETHPKLMEKYHSYLDKIKDNLQKKGINCVVRKKNSKTLRCNWEQFIQECEKPYMFFLEHDWKFLCELDTEKIINLLEENTSVNYLRLPKMKLTNSWFNSMCSAQNWDWICQPVENQQDIPLSRISFMSGNPHFARVSFLKEFVVPNLQKYTPAGKAKGRSHLEKDLKNAIMSTIDESRNCGKIKEWGHKWPLSHGSYVGKGCKFCQDAIVKQHLKWGTYMYGTVNQEAVVGHLGDWCVKC